MKLPQCNAIGVRTPPSLRRYLQHWEEEGLASVKFCKTSFSSSKSKGRQQCTSPGEHEEFIVSV